VRVGRWVPYESLFEPRCMRLSLTRRRVISLTNLRTVLLGLYPGRGMHHSSDKHLVCGNGMNLHCCEGTTATGDFSMAIMTLDNHYSMLS
jgi:hypothetical protein